MSPSLANGKGKREVKIDKKRPKPRADIVRQELLRELFLGPDRKAPRHVKIAPPAMLTSSTDVSLRKLGGSLSTNGRR